MRAHEPAIAPLPQRPSSIGAWTRWPDWVHAVGEQRTVPASGAAAGTGGGDWAVGVRSSSPENAPSAAAIAAASTTRATAHATAISAHDRVLASRAVAAVRGPR